MSPLAPLTFPGRGAGDHRQIYLKIDFLYSEYLDMFHHGHLMDSMTGTHLVPPSYALPADEHPVAYAPEIRGWLDEAIAALGEEKLRDYIQTIGLYKTKAKNVIGLTRILLNQYGGEVPNDREALEALPGVGRKTANVVLNIAYGEPTIAVDTHIFRVSNRTGLAPGKDPLQVELKLEKFVPNRLARL